MRIDIMGTRKVTVVVCVYNGVDFTEKCLNSILSQDFGDYEVVVIDDGSSDGTVEVLEKFKTNEKIRFYYNRNNLGLMKSRNTGVDKAVSEIVAFTDSDCIVDEGWLSELIKPFGFDKDIAVVGGRILDRPISNYWDLVSKGLYKIAPESGYVKTIFGGNMAFRKQFLLDNKFDGTLKYGADEADLCMRALGLGFKIYFHNDAKVIHFHRNTFRGIIKQRFLLGIGNCYFRFKHKIFPPISVKSIILLLMPLSVIFNTNVFITSLLVGSYISVVFYEDTRSKEKSLKELIFSVPGRLIMAIVESSAYIYGVFKVLEIGFRRKLVPK